MSMNASAAIPYFYAAGVQAITAVSAQLAGNFTSKDLKVSLLQPVDYQPIANGGLIPQGTLKGNLIPAELSPYSVLQAASRDRDIATIITGIAFLVVPIALSASKSTGMAQVVFIAIALLSVVLAVLAWRWRAALSKRSERPGPWKTNIAVGILILVNVAVGLYSLFQPVPHAACKP
jgi:hypothetical protein